VILVGSQVVGRAFVQAYRQAAANSAAQAGATNGVKGAASKISGTNLITRQTRIDLDEACKILNVNKNSLVLEEINKVASRPQPFFLSFPHSSLLSVGSL